MVVGPNGLVINCADFKSIYIFVTKYLQDIPMYSLRLSINHPIIVNNKKYVLISGKNIVKVFTYVY